jgi:hypothetical protein
LSFKSIVKKSFAGLGFKLTSNLGFEKIAVTVPEIREVFLTLDREVAIRALPER